MREKKELKTIKFRWYDNVQALKITTLDRKGLVTGEVALGKQQIFSTGIEIDQIKRAKFEHKGLKRKIIRLEAKAERFREKAEKLKERIKKLKSSKKDAKMKE